MDVDAITITSVGESGVIGTVLDGAKSRVISVVSFFTSAEINEQALNEAKCRSYVPQAATMSQALIFGNSLI